MTTTETTVNVYAEVARLRGLAAEMGNDTDPLALAVQELALYKIALREARRALTDAGLSWGSIPRSALYAGPESGD